MELRERLLGCPPEHAVVFTDDDKLAAFGHPLRHNIWRRINGNPNRNPRPLGLCDYVLYRLDYIRVV
jgi:hypothetical protein